MSSIAFISASSSTLMLYWSAILESVSPLCISYIEISPPVALRRSELFASFRSNSACRDRILFVSKIIKESSALPNVDSYVFLYIIESYP